MSKRVVTAAVAAALLAGSAGHAASPMMSTSPALPGATCGAPEDVCVPSVDVFTNAAPTAPPVVLPGFFGLVPGDDVTGLSWGLDSLTGGETILFSVDPLSVGVPGTGVFAESGAFDHSGDVFAGGTLAAPVPNVLAVDGDAIPAGPPASGLAEPGFDDLDAMSTCDPAAALLAGFVPYITLAPFSPTALAFGLSGADILIAPPGGPPGPFVPGAAMGLVAIPACGPPACDAIDALAVDLAGATAVFSLAPGSPTLAGFGITPDDLLIAPGFGPTVPFLPGVLIGLVPGVDDLDAIDLALDADGDLVNDACDNCVGVPNNDQLDSNADGLGDACTPTTTTTSSTTTTTLPGIPIPAKKLIVIDKLTVASKAKVVYVAKDPVATKGSGTDPEAISVTFDFDYANGSAGGGFVVPAGTANGWVVNKTTVAKYVNKSAPAGPTGVKVAVIKPTKLLKVVGKSLGDTPIDIFATGAPDASGVDTEFTVVNGAETNRHCTNFAGADCTYKLIAGGTGAKLVCKPGTGASC